MKTSPRRRKHRRRAFRRLFWLLVLATLLLLLWPRRLTLDGLNSPHAILLQADSGEVLAEKDADSTIYPASMTKMMTALLAMKRFVKCFSQFIDAKQDFFKRKAPCGQHGAS